VSLCNFFSLSLSLALSLFFSFLSLVLKNLFLSLKIQETGCPPSTYIHGPSSRFKKLAMFVGRPVSLGCVQTPTHKSHHLTRDIAPHALFLSLSRFLCLSLYPSLSLFFSFSTHFSLPRPIEVTSRGALGFSMVVQ